MKQLGLRESSLSKMEPDMLNADPRLSNLKMVTLGAKDQLKKLNTSYNDIMVALYVGEESELRGERNRRLDEYGMAQPTCTFDDIITNIIENPAENYDVEGKYVFILGIKNDGSVIGKKMTFERFLSEQSRVNTKDYRGIDGILPDDIFDKSDIDYIYFSVLDVEDIMDGIVFLMVDVIGTPNARQEEIETKRIEAARANAKKILMDAFEL